MSLRLPPESSAGGPAGLVLADAERLQLRAHAALEGVAALLLELAQQPLLAAQHPRHAAHVAEHLGIGQLRRGAVEIGLDLGQLGARSRDDLQRRARVGAHQLREVARGHVAPPHGQIRVGLLEAREDAEQG